MIDRDFLKPDANRTAVILVDDIGGVSAFVGLNDFDAEAEDSFFERLVWIGYVTRINEEVEKDSPTLSVKFISLDFGPSAIPRINARAHYQ